MEYIFTDTKIYMEIRRIQCSKNNLEKKHKVIVLIFPNFKTFSHQDITVIMTVWYRHKDRHRDQWNIIESPELNFHNIGQFIFGKDNESIQWGKNILSTNNDPRTKVWSYTSFLLQILSQNGW
jgi:hypothetical protein